MKREIKFRAKRVNNGKWVYGDLLSDNELKYIFPSTYGWFEFKEKLCKVIPETVGQYTGLKDKDGKEIYEGDVCKTYNSDYPYNCIDMVVFDEGSFIFKNDQKLSIEIRGFNNNRIKIIGNIHDNPELLNQKEAK